MNNLYVWKLWKLAERHLARQIRRHNKYDKHLTYISVRELRFAVRDFTNG